jgi:hypothetical protein
MDTMLRYSPDTLNYVHIWAVRWPREHLNGLIYHPFSCKLGSMFWIIVTLKYNVGFVEPLQQPFLSTREYHCTSETRG